MNKEEVILDLPSYLQKRRTIFLHNWNKKEEPPTHSKDEFKFMQIIGKGGFSNVVLAKRNKSLYAIKVMKKSLAMNVSNFSHVMNERRSLQATQFPFLIHMVFYFSDSNNLYFVTPYIPGGDLWQFLRQCKKLSEESSIFYATQIILALEYLHFMDIIYRDLKPENIFINSDGYIKLGDLGFCKRIKTMTYTMCGTTQYMAPEVLMNYGYGFGADWWSLGVLLFEMCAGFTPFVCKDEGRMCERITHCDYVMENNFTDELKDLISNLLQILPSRRLGNLRNGVEDVKNHRWFQNVVWLDVLNKRLTPPYVPKITSPPKNEFSPIIGPDESLSDVFNKYE